VPITDNRTSLTTNDATGLDDLTGSASGANNNEYNIEGTNCQGVKISASVDGLLYDAGSAQNWTNNTFYIWWNCLTFGLLNTEASGGIRVRFCGATVSDWFEVYIAGSDTYTGGYRMAVVEADEARALAVTNGWTNGTTPATSAIRYVGIVFDVTGMVTGNVNNCFVDAMWRLPANTPGILVTQQNTGSVDWTWQDIVDAGDVGDTTKAWGTVRRLENGTISLNTPVRFGANDTNTHGFSDTNETVGFEDALVPDGFYGLDVLGNAGGTTDFALGSKTGTGDAATGAQGGVILTAGPRFYIDVDDANIDSAAFYGVTLQGGGVISSASTVPEWISCILLDCSSMDITGAGNGKFVRNQVVNAATADGVAFLTTDDISDVDFCTFNFSDGHAIELTTPRVASQTSKGNRFLSYGATGTNDAAIYNNTAGAVTITLTDGATLAEHTYRNGTSASTTVVANAVTLEITVIDGVTKAGIQNVRTLVWCTGTGSFPSEDAVTITRSGSTASVSHTAHGLSNGDEVRIAGVDPSQAAEYNGIFTISNVTTNAYDYTVSGTPPTPAPGSPTSSLVLINGLTNASGVISDTRSYGSNQDITGHAYRGGQSPAIGQEITGTVLSASGLPVTVQLVADG
jgi:hypothetical protein